MTRTLKKKPKNKQNYDYNLFTIRLHCKLQQGINAFKQVFQYKFAQAICKCVIEEAYVEKAKAILGKQNGFVAFVEK